MGHMQKSSSNDQNLKARPRGRKCRSRKAVRFVLRNCRSYRIALVDDESLQVSKMMNFWLLLSMFDERLYIHNIYIIRKSEINTLLHSIQQCCVNHCLITITQSLSESALLCGRFVGQIGRTMQVSRQILNKNFFE